MSMTVSFWSISENWAQSLFIVLSFVMEQGNDGEIRKATSTLAPASSKSRITRPPKNSS